MNLSPRKRRFPVVRWNTEPVSIGARVMGLEAFTDALSLPAGTTIGGATIDSSNRVVNATGSTLTVTKAAHDGKIITLNRALGVAIQLPNATGTGSVYTFVNMTALSGGSHVLTRGVTGDSMTGICTIGAAAATSVGFLTASNSNVITLNATTSGGLGGDLIQLIDVATNQWWCNLELWGSGSIVTPFSHT